MSLALLRQTLARIEADDTLPEKLKAEMLQETKRRIDKHGRIEHNWGAPLQPESEPETHQPLELPFQDGI